MKSTPHSRFRISNLPFIFAQNLKHKIGTRNYRLICAATFTALIAAIVIPISLSMSQEESFAADTTSREKVVDVRFLNTHTKQALYDLDYDPETRPLGHATNTGAANLIKTKDNQYVLIDTAYKNEVNFDTIYQALKDYQGKSKVNLDYLIISHMHDDHYGNAIDIINSNNITVKNLIIKSGKGQAGIYDNIIRAAKNEKANIYTNIATREIDGVQIQNFANYHRMNDEGVGNAVIPVGDYLTLYFYNTTNVYSGQDCVSGYSVSWLRKSSNVPTTSDGKYLGFDNTGFDYPNINYAYYDSLVADGLGYNKHYYAFWYRGKKRTFCNDNGNSYGILAEVKTDAGNKYMYFANDIDNTGYDIKPTKTNVTYINKSGNSVTKKNHYVYGQGLETLYETSDISLVKNGTTKIKNVAYSETKAALEAKDRIGANNLSNLVIYQVSHHGINNAPDALETLNINRAGIYAVVNRGSPMSDRSEFYYQRTKYYLSKVSAEKKLLRSGYNKGEGVYCAIDNTGDYKCSYDEVKVGTLKYNLNGGSGSIANQTCLNDGSCNITISATTPTREGYKFLGWNTSANASSAVYAANKSISVSGEITLYAIWAPTYTLVYDLNGGTGTVPAQTCNPTTTNGTCLVSVTSAIPTREGYKFLGWAATSNAVIPATAKNNLVYLSTNSTLYAVWQRVIDINTSVDGVGGTITPSMTAVPQGKTVTVVFSPRSGYEIDTVTINAIDKTAEVSNNQLTLTAGDEDLNVIVRYKLTPTPEPTPTPEIITQTFHMYFSSANGGTNLPATESCIATSPSEDTLSCNITIPTLTDETTPVRDGYTFLGYGNFSDFNTVAYQPGETYTLSNDIYVIAVWAPIYTLNYDFNGGEGTIDAQTCHSDTATDTCSIILSTARPTLDEYEFFGWATDPKANTPEYLPGDTFTFQTEPRAINLYAIWIEGGVEWYQGQDYARGSEVDLIVRIKYPMQNFASLEIDENLVDASNYTVTSGSTIITLNHEYVEELEAGGHTLRANYNNGVSAQTTFAVTEEEADTNEYAEEEDEDTDWDDLEDEDSLNDANDDSGDIAVPDTGGNTDSNVGSSAAPYLFFVLIAILFITTPRLAKKLHRRNKFGL